VPEERVIRATTDHRFAVKLLAWTVGAWLIVLGLLFEAAACRRKPAVP
jgi:hypothetical protein